MEKRDISKDVVVVLLLLTVIVALVGTWSVTGAAKKIQIVEEKTEEPGIKTSGFVISEPPKPTTGKASIIILNPGDELQ